MSLRGVAAWLPFAHPTFVAVRSSARGPSVMLAHHFVQAAGLTL
jgi:hypothetical protein